jgi:hypothetical protein
MSKKIIASLALGLVLAVSAVTTVSTIGCGGDSNNGGSGGGGGGGAGGGGGGTGGGGGDADMSFVCVPNPTSDPDFLNGCPPAGVDTFEINPTFPDKAPNGVLPAIQ